VKAAALVDKLGPSPEFDGAALVERLISQLTSLQEPVVLVIDDLHELLSPEALAQLELLLDFVLGRFEEALAGFRSAERLQAMLVTPHAFTAQMREWLVLTLLRLGRTSEGHEVLAQLSDEVRQWGEARTALAVVCLVDGDAQAADEVLDLVLNGSAPVLHSGSLIEALLVQATVRDRLRDARGAEAAIERALDMAEPDRQIFRWC
jgi:LuxR family maltose regulon positive regulatory protein